MLTLEEIFAFINKSNVSELKEYYSKCSDSLKELNVRSNVITFVLIVIVGFYLFSSYITELRILGFTINRAVIMISAPLLIPYLTLEWALIARRRRELIKTIKYVGINIFPIEDNNVAFLHINLLVRNIMPFSFLVEMLNINITSKVNGILNLCLVYFVLISVPVFIALSIYVSFLEFKFILPTVFCNLFALYFSARVFLFYKNDWNEMKRVRLADEFYNSTRVGKEYFPGIRR